jgi:pyridoxamine 5'-phosphate oxidase
MALGTVGADGRPSVRIVYCRGLDEDGVRFFTSYVSRKAAELFERPYAAVAFHWGAAGHQVRIEGPVERLAAEESDAYFRARPRDNQLSAAVSPQSAPIESLDALRARKKELEASLGGGDVPRPANWGGYRLRPDRVELWTRGAGRLHDRIVYERRRDGPWIAQRLAP